MTGTVDIQELKKLAEAALRRPLNAYHEASIEAVNFYRAASPDTILALIEVAEAAKGMLAHACIADADPSDVDEEDRALERRLRTALEGVKG